MAGNMAYPPWRRRTKAPYKPEDGETCIDGSTHEMAKRNDGSEECEKCGYETAPPMEGSYEKPQIQVSGEGNDGPTNESSKGPPRGRDYKGERLSKEAIFLENKARVWSRNLDPDRKKAMQRDAERIMEAMCVYVGNSRDALRTRKEILNSALKRKRAILRSKNHAPGFCPQGRRDNALVAAFCVELFHQEGEEVGSVGVDGIMSQMRDYLSSRNEEELLEKEEPRIRSYLSRDIRALRKILGVSRRRKDPSDSTWPSFLTSCHEMMSKSGLQESGDWQPFMDWCRQQDRGLMAEILPPSASARRYVAFEMVRRFAGKPTRKKLMDALGLDSGSFRSAGYSSKAEEIAGMW